LLCVLPGNNLYFPDASFFKDFDGHLSQDLRSVDQNGVVWKKDVFQKRHAGLCGFDIDYQEGSLLCA
jgi:hypothetical protein